MKLQEVILKTKYLDKLAGFYRDVMELPVDELGERIIIKAGHSLLIFESTTGDENPFYHFAFNIPSNKLDEAFEWTKERVNIIWLEDYKSYIADFKSWNAKSFYFLDPAGNILELIARLDQKDFTDEKFSTEQIRNVSEIGIVFSPPSFKADVEHLSAKYCLNYFSKQPPLDHFKAIGDDEGLFVMVPQSRNWFSTNMPAGLFPISVKFIDQDKNHQLII